MNRCVMAALLTAVAFGVDASPVKVTRVFRPARYSRGNTNMIKQQPIDSASWIWLKDDADAKFRFLKFRREFTVDEKDTKFTIDISADERYYFAIDGEFVSRGPNRSTVENWQYNTYELELAPGKHVAEATVWRIGNYGPLAQLSGGGGFVLKASGAYDKQLTTGVAEWQVGVIDNVEDQGHHDGAWGTGNQWRILGSGIVDCGVKEWTKAAVKREGAGREGKVTYGSRTPGWMLFPSQIPDQTEVRVRPGAFRAASKSAEWRKHHTYTEAEAKSAEVAVFNRLLKGEAITVPAHTRMQLAWDLGRYYCGYPELELGPSKDARISWCWEEATQRGSDNRKGGEPGARDLIVGRYLYGYGDVYVADAEKPGKFTPPWFRCGKWCRVDVETHDQPLEIRSMSIVESRYPLEMESAFSTPQDPSLAPIRDICARAMQMCCHEMLFDCPFYEQQMYPGDTRVQLNVISAMTRDERMIERVIELYDLGSRDDGQCPFNWPTRGLQEGATYTLCYLCMYGDYVMNHSNREWLRARLPGFRRTMAGMEYYENEEGFLDNLPGWSFMDWVPRWQRGVAPNGIPGNGPNAEANLFWVLAMQSAAMTEQALGHDLQARYWLAKCEQLKAKIIEKFWSDERGLLADTPAKRDFSEHSQALAILGDVLPPEKRDLAFRHLIEDTDLDRCTVYFSYYLFEAYFKMGRADLFQKRLDLWRDYVKKGLTTTQEAPDGVHESRSDCHAWGAHPIWMMQTGLVGIRSDAPFFSRVRVAPCPGTLKELSAKHPHPQGYIEVSLKFNGDDVTGTVSTPVPGVFEYHQHRIELKPGSNAISMAK